MPGTAISADKCLCYLLGSMATAIVAGCGIGQDASGPTSPPATKVSSTEASAEKACGTYFASDLALRGLLDDVVNADSVEWKARLRDYRLDVSEFVGYAVAAVGAGTLPNEVQTHAQRIASILGDASQESSETFVRKAALVSRYGRSVEVICVAAGVQRS